MQPKGSQWRSGSEPAASQLWPKGDLNLDVADPPVEESWESQRNAHFSVTSASESDMEEILGVCALITQAWRCGAYVGSW